MLDLEYFERFIKYTNPSKLTINRALRPSRQFQKSSVQGNLVQYSHAAEKVTFLHWKSELFNTQNLQNMWNKQKTFIFGEKTLQAWKSQSEPELKNFKKWPQNSTFCFLMHFNMVILRNLSELFKIMSKTP